MKIVYSSFGIGALLALSTLTYMCALISSTLGHTFFSWDPQAHVTHMVQFKLLICVEECVCTDACTHMDYSDGRLSCDLVTRSQAYRNLQLEGRVGEMKSEDHDISLLTNVSKDTGAECTSLITPMCPDLVTENDTLLLENLDTTGSQRLIQFTWPPGHDGWNTTSCEAVATCVNLDVRRKMPSTMRSVCKSDSECLDKNSECRGGQCWCKPGLSHDLDSRTCVVMCPGQCGTTFQIVDNVYDPYSVPFKTESLQVCMDECATFVKPTYTCKYLAHLWGHCNLYKVIIPENQKPTLFYTGGCPKYIQRDCGSGIDYR